MADATIEQISALIDRGGLDGQTHHVLASIHAKMSELDICDTYVASISHSVQFGMRADSHGAPSTHADAIARGPPWPGAIDKEFKNHNNNESWDMINRSDVPVGRRIHKFVWVFKEKRDGTAKARLCVQGCTLEEGIDYDQTFAKPLRHFFYIKVRSLKKFRALWFHKDPSYK